MSHVYANAEEVLPPHLLKEVRRHWTGHLYIGSSAKERLTSVAAYRLISSGVPASTIAVMFNVTIRRVYQIAQISVVKRKKMR